MDPVQSTSRNDQGRRIPSSPALGVRIRSLPTLRRYGAFHSSNYASDSSSDSNDATNEIDGDGADLNINEEPKPKNGEDNPSIGRDKEMGQPSKRPNQTSKAAFTYIEDAADSDAVPDQKRRQAAQAMAKPDSKAHQNNESKNCQSAATSRQQVEACRQPLLATGLGTRGQPERSGLSQYNGQPLVPLTRKSLNFLPISDSTWETWKEQSTVASDLRRSRPTPSHYIPNWPEIPESESDFIEPPPTESPTRPSAPARAQDRQSRNPFMQIRREKPAQASNESQRRPWAPYQSCQQPQPQPQQHQVPPNYYSPYPYPPPPGPYPTPLGSYAPLLGSYPSPLGSYPPPLDLPPPFLNLNTHSAATGAGPDQQEFRNVQTDPEKEKLERQLAEVKSREDEFKMMEIQRRLETNIRNETEAVFMRRMEDMIKAQDEAKKEIERAQVKAERAVRERLEQERKQEEEQTRSRVLEMKKLEEEARRKFEAELKQAEEARRTEAKIFEEMEEKALTKLKDDQAAEENAKWSLERMEEKMRVKIEKEMRCQAEAEEAEKQERTRLDMIIRERALGIVEQVMTVERDRLLREVHEKYSDTFEAHMEAPVDARSQQFLLTANDDTTGLQGAFPTLFQHGQSKSPIRRAKVKTGVRNFNEGTTRSSSLDLPLQEAKFRTPEVQLRNKNYESKTSVSSEHSSVITGHTLSSSMEHLSPLPPAPDPPRPAYVESVSEDDRSYASPFASSRRPWRPYVIPAESDSEVDHPWSSEKADMCAEELVDEITGSVFSQLGISQSKETTFVSGYSSHPESIQGEKGFPGVRYPSGFAETIHDDSSMSNSHLGADIRTAPGTGSGGQAAPSWHTSVPSLGDESERRVPLGSSDKRQLSMSLNTNKEMVSGIAPVSLHMTDKRNSSRKSEAGDRGSQKPGEAPSIIDQYRSRSPGSDGEGNEMNSNVLGSENTPTTSQPPVWPQWLNLSWLSYVI